MEKYTITQSQILELASELAHDRTVLELCEVNEDEILEEDENGHVIYTDDGQEVFNDHYDYYLSMIENILKQ